MGTKAQGGSSWMFGKRHRGSRPSCHAGGAAPAWAGARSGGRPRTWWPPSGHRQPHTRDGGPCGLRRSGRSVGSAPSTRASSRGSPTQAKRRASPARLPAVPCSLRAVEPHGRGRGQRPACAQKAWAQPHTCPSTRAPPGASRPGSAGVATPSPTPAAPCASTPEGLGAHAWAARTTLRARAAHHTAHR